MNEMPGWPSQIDLMQTSGGAHILVFREEAADPRERLDHRMVRVHPFTNKQERGYHYPLSGVSSLHYFPREIYEPLLQARGRAIKCLQGKGAENFAQQKNSL